MDEQINGVVETIQQLEKENAELKLRLVAVMQRSEQLEAFIDEYIEAWEDGMAGDSGLVYDARKLKASNCT
jgi:hypothetical protein